MAISTYKIKLSPMEAIFKIINDTNTVGSTTISISSLRHVIEGEPVSPKVNVSAIEVSLAVDTKLYIKRGANTSSSMFTNTNQMLNVYASINELNDQDITVTLTGEGMVNIRLLKVSGFSPSVISNDVPVDWEQIGFTWIQT